MSHLYRGRTINDKYSEEPWEDVEGAAFHGLIDDVEDKCLQGTRALSEIKDLGLQAQARSNLGITFDPDLSNYYTKPETNALLDLKADIDHQHKTLEDTIDEDGITFLGRNDQDELSVKTSVNVKHIFDNSVTDIEVNGISINGEYLKSTITLDYTENASYPISAEVKSSSDVSKLEVSRTSSGIIMNDEIAFWDTVELGGDGGALSTASLFGVHEVRFNLGIATGSFTGKGFMSNGNLLPEWSDTWVYDDGEEQLYRTSRSLTISEDKTGRAIEIKVPYQEDPDLVYPTIKFTDCPLIFTYKNTSNNTERQYLIFDNVGQKVTVGSSNSFWATNSHLQGNSYIGDNSSNTYIGDYDQSNYTKFETDGTMVMNGTATVFEDLTTNIVDLQQTGPGVSKNISENSVEFLVTSDLNDYIIASFQIPHKWKVGSIVYPHIHWWQTTNAVPNFLLEYRWQVLGASKTTSWTKVVCKLAAISYTSGTIDNIAKTNSGITPPNGAGISDVLQFRIYRDNANASTSFVGTDPVNATVSITNFDLHYESDTLGSHSEYTK